MRLGSEEDFNNSFLPTKNYPLKTFDDQKSFLEKFSNFSDNINGSTWQDVLENITDINFDNEGNVTDIFGLAAFLPKTTFEWDGTIYDLYKDENTIINIFNKEQINKKPKAASGSMALLNSFKRQKTSTSLTSSYSKDGLASKYSSTTAIKPQDLYKLILQTFESNAKSDTFKNAPFTSLQKGWVNGKHIELWNGNKQIDLAANIPDEQEITITVKLVDN